jgi:hypothetical protein
METRTIHADRCPGIFMESWAVDEDTFARLLLAPESVQREFACRCAERVINSLDEPDPAVVSAVAVGTHHARGRATTTELETARAVVDAAVTTTQNAVCAAYLASDRNPTIRRVLSVYTTTAFAVAPDALIAALGAATLSLEMDVTGRERGAQHDDLIALSQLDGVRRHDGGERSDGSVTDNNR